MAVMETTATVSHCLMASTHSLSAAVLSAVLAGVPALASAQTFTFERSFATAGVPVIDIQTERGKVDVRPSTGDRVEVIGRVTVRSDWNPPVNAVELAQMAADRPSVEHEGQTIRIRAPREMNVRDAVTVAYELRVPVASAVSVRGDSSAVTIDGINGAVDVQTQSGAISIAGLGGTCRISTGSGAVFLDRIAGAVSVTTTSGAITAHGLGAAFTARTGSGRITAVLTGTGDTDLRSESSAISVNGARGGLIVTTNSGAIDITGDPRREWRISSASSAIDARLQGSPVSLDATSSSSDVEIDPRGFDGVVEKGRANGRLRGGGVPVVITSRSGRIRIAVD